MRHSTTYTSASQITILVISYAILWLISTFSAVASSDSLSISPEPSKFYKNPGKLLLDCKTYVKGHKPNYTHRARHITIECVNLTDKKTIVHISKSGKATLSFKLDTRYLVYVSKEGYETKVLAFSTKGANPTAVYEFDFDLMLEKVGIAKYNERTPSIYIIYNRMHRLFLYRRYLFRASLDH